MKTLCYLRHSIKDANNNISPEGIELAKKQGQILVATMGNQRQDNQIRVDRIFVGPLVRTVQTRDAFFFHVVPTLMLDEITAEIPNIGTDGLFKEIVSDEFKDAVKSGKSNFEATLGAHSPGQVLVWSRIAYHAVDEMIASLEEGQKAIAFGHSPMIELAAYYIHSGRLPAEYRRLAEMEGLVFVHDQNRGTAPIRVHDRVAAPAR